VSEFDSFCLSCIRHTKSYNQAPMTKYFCDLCEVEMTYETMVHIDPRGRGFYPRYVCLSCFQNKGNWEQIQILVTQRSEERKRIDKLFDISSQ
jgi:hypothetical protein